MKNNLHDARKKKKGWGGESIPCSHECAKELNSGSCLQLKKKSFFFCFKLKTQTDSPAGVTLAVRSLHKRGS